MTDKKPMTIDEALAVLRNGESVDHWNYESRYIRVNVTASAVKKGEVELVEDQPYIESHYWTARLGARTDSCDSPPPNVRCINEAKLQEAITVLTDVAKTLRILELEAEVKSLKAHKIP